MFKTKEYAIQRLMILSNLHICTTGGLSSKFGTRRGDSGSPLNLFENGRYRKIGIMINF